MSVSAERGAHRSVSRIPNGCRDPKCTRTIGVLIRKAAIPEASAFTRNSPAMPTQTGIPRRGSSRGIHQSQRIAIGAARWRSASTQPKLSWNPGLTASDGSCTSIMAAAMASSASAFHSRPQLPPIAPPIAIRQDRIALAAGAISASAASAAIPIAALRSRPSRVITPAAAPTIQPSTARLKPEIARMCESPTSRNASSIGRYPSSTSPRTSATSMGRIAAAPSPGTPESRPLRMRSRSESRIDSNVPATGACTAAGAMHRIRAGDSTAMKPTTPSSARYVPNRSVPGITGVGRPRSSPVSSTRSIAAKFGIDPRTVTRSRARTSASGVRLPSFATNTTFPTTASYRSGVSRCLERTSLARLRSTKRCSKVASIFARVPSCGARSVG